MNTNIKYTFIIPVYNTPTKLLDRCISSLINQDVTHQNYEIIIVDDGSSNRETLDYLNKIKNEKCTVYYEPNHGVSYARNYGIRKANSNNIIFIDSDDYILDSLISKLEEIQIENYDIVYFKNYINNENSSRLFKAKNFNLGVVWAKVFKKNIIIENNITFNTYLKFCEDSIFLHQYLKYVKNIYKLYNYEYVYFINKKSVGHKYNDKNYIYFNDSINYLKPYLSETELDMVILLFFINYVLPTTIFHKESSLSYLEKKHKAISILHNSELNYQKILSFNYKQYKLIQKIDIFLIKKYKFKTLLLFNKMLNKIKCIVRRT